MTFRSPVSRRSLLKALGSAAAVAPLSSLLTASITEAAAPVAPLRLITLFGYYHTSEPFFHPHDVASSAPARAGSAFTLNFPNSVLAPLAPHQNKLMVIRGLNYESPATTPNGGHSSGQTVLTGSHCVYGTNACDGDGTGCRTTGTSIDQFLFSRLGHSGSRQPIVARLTNQATPICFANGVALPGVRNPTQLFNSYFAGTVGGGSSQAVRQLARRNSAIGFASDGARSLASRLAGSEKAKLDQHLSALQGLKSSLNASLPVTNSCSPPAAGSISNDPGTNTGGADVGKYRPDTESFLTLISQAFACDLTRFATLILPDLAGADLVTQMAGLENFAATADDLHGYGHGATGANDNDCDLKSALHSREWASVVQRLMNKLEAISDPMAPGQTLLDNTMIVLSMQHRTVVGNQYGGLVHGYCDIPFVVAGGCAGQFTMGRIVETTPRLSMPNARGLYQQTALGNQHGEQSVYLGVPHNALLGAVVNAFEKNQAQHDPTYTPQLVSRYGDYATAPLVLT